MKKIAIGLSLGGGAGFLLYLLTRATGGV